MKSTTDFESSSCKISSVTCYVPNPSSQQDCFVRDYDVSRDYLRLDGLEKHVAPCRTILHLGLHMVLFMCSALMDNAKSC